MIRIYQSGDHLQIAEIFPRAVHEIASRDYSTEQCLAWSGREANPGHWQKRCELMRPFVYEVEGVIRGFLELEPNGHIDCAYVNPDFQRQGVMKALVEHAVATAFAMGRERVFVEASITARPFFAGLSFAVVEEQEVVINGVALTNYRMEKRNPAPSI